MLDPRLGWWLATALSALVVVGLVLWLLRRTRGSSSSPVVEDRLDTVAGWPPQVTRLLTPPERLAFITLRQALPEHVVLSQVPLARFITVPKRNSYAEWLRRVGYQSIDFLVCDTDSRIVAVVDVQQPPMQTSPRAAKRQSRISRTLKAAGVPMHVWLATSLPTAEMARDALLGMSDNVVPASKAGSARSDRSDATVTRPMIVQAGAGNPFEDAGRDSTQDELIEAQEPPLSTWYDEFDSGLAPLAVPDKRHGR